MPRPLAAALLCIAVTAALPAGAQITPAELWQDWQQAAADRGHSLTAAAAPGADGSLALTAIELGRSVLGAPGVVSIGAARLEPDGAGGVRVVIAAGQTIAIDLAPPGQEPGHIALPVSGEDMVLHASGAPGAVAYDLDGADILIDGAPLTKGAAADPATSDPALPADRIRLALPDLSGHVAADGTARFAAPSLDYDLAVTNPATGRRDQTSGRHAQPVLTVTPQPGDTAQTAATRIALTSAAAEQGWRSGDLAAGVSGVTLARDQGALALTLGPDRFELRSHDQGVRLTTLSPSPDEPALGLQAASLDLSLAGPAALAGGDPTLTLGAVAEGLTLPPEDWARIDPQGQMARAPGSLVLDVDLLPEFAATPLAPDMAVEGQIRAVTLHRLSLDLAGITLDARGDVRFVPAPAPDTPGAVQPVGRIDTAATGVTGLLRALTGAGLLSQDQALGLSMAMMMFAQPGEGDSLTSSVVAGADGSLTVNGRAMSLGTP